MTDFLTSLTARSFGTETAIRPRVASLFEPVRNGDAALREPAAEPIDTTIAREVEVESDGERERKRSRPAPALREDGNASKAKPSAEANSVLPLVSPPREDSERPRTIVLADEPREEEDTVVAARVRPRREMHSEEENANESEPGLRSDSEAGTPKPVSTREREEDTVVAAKVRPGRALVSQEENANESEPGLRSNSKAGTPKRVSTRAAAVSDTRDESSENDHRGLVLPPRVFPELMAQMKNAALAMNVGLSPPAREKAGIALPALAAEPESSVHVTIGRIEVRATPESKPAGRLRPASIMSLEEYLHRRTQRGGR